MHFSQIRKLRDLDLDLRSGRNHTGVHMWPYTKLHENRKNFLWTYGRTDGRTRLQIVDLLGHRRDDDLINRAIRQNNARPSVFSSDNAHNLTNEYHRANYVRPIKAIQLFAHAPIRVSCERCPTSATISYKSFDILAIRQHLG